MENANLIMAYHILFVDDDLPLRETLSLYLRRKGIAVTAAANSEEAKRLAEKGGFNAIILDVDLGGESGMELLDFFGQKYPELPVVMFTSAGTDAVLRADALARGAKGFFCKTESLGTLLSGVQKVMA